MKPYAQLLAWAAALVLMVGCTARAESQEQPPTQRQDTTQRPCSDDIEVALRLLESPESLLSISAQARRVGQSVDLLTELAVYLSTSQGQSSTSSTSDRTRQALLAVRRVLHEVRAGDGTALRSFADQVARQFPGADLRRVAEVLEEANRLRALCQGRYMTIEELLRHVVERLRSQTPR